MKIRNKKTGEVREVADTELNQYGLSNEPQINEQKLYQIAYQIADDKEKAKLAAEWNATHANKLFETAAPTEEEKALQKTQKESSGVMGLVDELKKLYNVPTSQGMAPGKGKESLAMGGEGVISALLGSAKGNLEAAGNTNVDAKTYKRLRSGFTSSLKAVTGDTGVITDQDFARISNILPNFGDTPETARKAWEEIDSILSSKYPGAKPAFSYLQQAQEQKVVPKTETPNPTVISPDQMQSIPQDKRRVKSDKLKQMQEVSKYILPEDQKTNPIMDILAKVQSAGANTQALPTGYGITGKVLGKGSSLSTGAGAGLGEYLKQILTPGQTIQDKGLSALVPTKEQTQQIGKTGATAGVLDFLLTGGSVGKSPVLNTKGFLGNLRSQAAAKSTAQVPTDILIKSGERALEKSSPTQATAIQKFLDVAKQKFQPGTKLNAPQALDLLTESNKAYSSAGKVGKAASALYNKEQADAIRSSLYPQDKKIALLNNLLSKTFNAEKMGGKIAGGAIQAGATAAGIALLKKIGLF